MSIHQIKWSTGDKISSSKIKELENIWEVQFPKLYCDIVTQHDDSTPRLLNEQGEWKTCLLDIPDSCEEPMYFGLLSYGNSNNIYQTKIYLAYAAFIKSLPNLTKVFPFAGDGNGNLLLFDYRKNANEPQIIYIDYEELGSYYVCNSFEELLNLIYPRPD